MIEGIYSLIQGYWVLWGGLLDKGISAAGNKRKKKPRREPTTPQARI